MHQQQQRSTSCNSKLSLLLLCLVTINTVISIVISVRASKWLSAVMFVWGNRIKGKNGRVKLRQQLHCSVLMFLSWILVTSSSFFDGHKFSHSRWLYPRGGHVSDYNNHGDDNGNYNNYNEDNYNHQHYYGEGQDPYSQHGDHYATQELQQAQYNQQQGQQYQNQVCLFVYLFVCLMHNHNQCKFDHDDFDLLSYLHHRM